MHTRTQVLPSIHDARASPARDLELGHPALFVAYLPLVVCTAAHPTRQAEIGTWAPVISKPFKLTEIDAFLAAATR